jgi:predicted transposase YbfD/YdcC
MTAKAAQYAVRSHWAVENKLHWVLDVLMREDLARNRTNHGAHNLAILRHMGTNLLRHDKTNKHSLKVRRKQAGWSTDYLAQLLGQVM